MFNYNMDKYINIVQPWTMEMFNYNMDKYINIVQPLTMEMFNYNMDKYISLKPLKCLTNMDKYTSTSFGP